jgi:ubiquitin C-terminal hydrolase
LSSLEEVEVISPSSASDLTYAVKDKPLAWKFLPPPKLDLISFDKENKDMTQSKAIYSPINYMNRNARYCPYPIKVDTEDDVDGLKNLGQTCYVASILQLLYSTASFKPSVLENRSFALGFLGKV